MIVNELVGHHYHSSSLRLVIAFSIIVFGDPIGVINAIGLFIAMAAFCFNSYLEYQVPTTSQSMASLLHADWRVFG